MHIPAPSLSNYLFAYISVAMLTTTERDIWAESVRRLASQGTGVSEAFATVAAQHGKSPGTVKNACYSAGGNATRNHGNRLLTKEQDNRFLAVLISFSALRHALTPHQAPIEAKELFGASMSMRALKRRLSARKSELKATKSKLLAKKRIDPELLKEALEFCAQIAEMRARCSMKAENAVSYDEARAHVGQGGKAVIESGRKRKGQRQGFHGVSVGALASFACAAAKAIMSVWAQQERKRGSGCRQISSSKQAICFARLLAKAFCICRVFLRKRGPAEKK